MVARGVRQILADAEIPLGRHNGGVAECELDLLERRVAVIGKIGERAAEIVRGDIHVEIDAVSPHNAEDRLRRDPFGQHTINFVDSPENGAGR
jgi:hypothetical protein